MQKYLQLPIYVLEYTVVPEAPSHINYWLGAYIRNNLLFAAASVPVDENTSLRDMISGDGQNDSPRPYAIQCDPVFKNMRINPSGSLTFRIMLFGKFMKYRDLMHQAVSIMCANGLGHPKVPMQIMSFSCRPAPAAGETDTKGGLYRIDFITPVSLYSNRAKSSSKQGLLDKQNGMPTLYYLILALTRRVNRLHVAHADGEAMTDEAIDSWCENARKAQVEECVLRRTLLQGTPKRDSAKSMFFAGHVGHMLLYDVDSQYLPLLQSGMYTSVGNDTTYGMGHFEISRLK